MYSATALVSTSGVLVTITPRRFAYATSTLSYPTATFATILSSGAASIAEASIRSVNTQTIACLSRTRVLSSSAGRLSPSCRSTSWRSSSRATTFEGSRLVTSTREFAVTSMADAGRRSVAVRLTVPAVITGHRGFYQARSVEIAATLQAEARVARMNEVDRRHRLRCRAGRRNTQMARDGVSYQRSESLFVHVRR